MEEGKETERKLMMKTKAQRTSGRGREDGRDRLSELHDCVLLHTMQFMDTRYAVRTCVLSKRWKDLWKCITSLSFRSCYFKTIASYKKFVSWVLSKREDSISLHNLDLDACRLTAPELLNKVTQYAMLHNVRQLTIYTNVYSRTMLNYSIPFVFSCLSLTFLKLSINGVNIFYLTLKLPKSLHLPALRSLHLTNVSFTVRDNDCAKPFSTCNLLNSLVLVGCSLDDDAKVLCISNSSLSSLYQKTSNEKKYKIVLSTPNLTSLTIMSYLSCHRLSSTCNFSFLEEVNIDIRFGIHYSVIVNWLLQLLSNVKILTLSL